jgi:hypothetical protein
MIAFDIKRRAVSNCVGRAKSLFQVENVFPIILLNCLNPCLQRIFRFSFFFPVFMQDFSADEVCFI